MQVRDFDGDLRRCGNLLMLFDGKLDRLGRDRCVLCQDPSQGILHRVLAIPRRQLQNLQVFAGCYASTVIPA